MALAAQIDAGAQAQSNPVAESFLACLARANHQTAPFDYWLLDGALPNEDLEAIVQPSPTSAGDGGPEVPMKALECDLSSDRQEATSAD